jgi:hypothetical protein
VPSGLFFGERMEMADIVGPRPAGTAPRWCIGRDVLGWID